MPTRTLDDACSILKEYIPYVLDKYRARYGDVMIARVGEVLRTSEEQKAKYARGRTDYGRIITNADGVKYLSAHQAQTYHGETCSHAVDIDVVTPDGSRYITDPQAYYPLIGLACAFGLRSGGDWVRPDLPHLYCPSANP